MGQKPILNEALGKAVELAGGQSSLASKIGKRQGDIWAWLFRTGVVPTEFLEAVETAVDGAVSIRELVRGRLSDTRAA
jgi:DNA-binding transcriptional regulator YdaS (Cro superfamily)